MIGMLIRSDQPQRQSETTPSYFHSKEQPPLYQIHRRRGVRFTEDEGNDELVPPSRRPCLKQLDDDVPHTLPRFLEKKQTTPKMTTTTTTTTASNTSTQRASNIHHGPSTRTDGATPGPDDGLVPLRPPSHSALRTPSNQHRHITTFPEDGPQPAQHRSTVTFVPLQKQPPGGKQLQSRKNKAAFIPSLENGVLGRGSSAIFCKRMAFRKSTSTSGRALSFRIDGMKLMDQHVRHLAGVLGESGKNLTLNKRGKCYFYIGRFLVHLEVPETSSNRFILTTTLHWALHDYMFGDDDDSFESLDSIVPKNMAIVKKGKHQVNLVCNKLVPPVYDNFRDDVNEFLAAAEDIKAQLKMARF